LTVLREIYINL